MVKKTGDSTLMSNSKGNESSSAAESDKIQGSENTESPMTGRCRENKDIDLHVWALIKETPNRCVLFNGIKVRLASFGNDHTVFLTRDQQVFSIGANKYGQLGVGDTEIRTKPCLVTGLLEKSIWKVSCGARHSGVVSKSGQVYCWGDSRQGQCGVGEKGLFTTPCRVQFVDSACDNATGTALKVRELSCGGLHSLAIDHKGFLWSWGTGAGIGLGQDVDECLFPCKVKSLHNKRAVAVCAGDMHSVALVQEDFYGSQFCLANEADNVESIGEALKHTKSDPGATIPFLENEFYAIQDLSYEAADTSSATIGLTRRLSSIEASASISQLATTCQEGGDADKEVDGQNAQGSCSTPRSRNSSAIKFENKLFDPEYDSQLPESEKNIVAQDSVISHSSIAGPSGLGNLVFENRLFAGDSNTDSANVSQITDLFETSCSTLVPSDAETVQLYSDSFSDSQDDTSQLLNLQYLDVSTSGKQLELPKPKKLEHQIVDVSTGEIFQSAFDILPSSQGAGWTGSNQLQISPTKGMVGLDDNRPTLLDSVSTESGNTLFDSTFGTSEWETKEPYSSHQPNHVNLFHPKPPQDRKRRAFSTWSLVSVMHPDERNSKMASFPIAGKTEVWAWGKNTYGQLGKNDTKDSYVPACIDKLSGKGIVKVVAGAYHSLALTNYCQVYAWGDNSFGQIAQTTPMVLLPKRIKMLSDVRVWDIAGGKSLSLFLGDNCDGGGSDVFFCGNMERKVERSFSGPLQDASVLEKKKSEKKWKKLSQRGKRNSDGAIQTTSVAPDVLKIVHFRTDVMIRSVAACDSQFACLTERVANTPFEVVYRFAYSERNYCCQLAMIQYVVLEPLRQTDHWTTVTKLPGGEALLRMVDSFMDILNGVAVGVSQLTDVVRHGRSHRDLFSFLFSDSFRGVYERFSKCYSDALAIGQLHACNKVVSSLTSKAREAMKKALQDLDMSSIDFDQLMKIPLRRQTDYLKVVEDITGSLQNGVEIRDADIAQLEEVRNRWYLFQEGETLRFREAESTRLYWEECPHKLMEALKEPQRRLLRTSKTEALSLARASRLANHSYVLFNDVFVHIQFNRNFQVFPLVTMWAEPEKDTDQLQYALRITAPEQSFVLCAATAAAKTAWLFEINKAIASCLSASSSHCIDITAVNTASGTLPAAVAREAWYTFVNHPRYKGARYTGMWLSGQPHGRGRIEWPDGMYYEGEFVNGNFERFGTMVYPAPAPGEAEKRYEGEWLEGKMRGYGKMSYGNKDEYVGQWKDNVRQGHGTMKHFSSTSSLQTVYVGDWSCDQKHGYGVLDLILRGEKYMGMWANDQRHGQGIVVTVDGVYYEGKFVQNKLVGKGVLLSDDDTCYEGEFTADMLLNGKGVLTFQNGDCIDGTFYGKWGEGIKVNGTFLKFGNPDPGAMSEGAQGQTGNSEFSIAADLKWKSLFLECKESLGYDGILEPNEYAVWAAVQEAILRAQSYGSFRKSIRSEYTQDILMKSGKIENRSKLVQDLKSLQNYLERAFDTFGHPLNTLVDSLVEVYRTTYVGVGAHRRLLPQAIAEAKSYVSRLFSVIRLLFPDLHDEEFVLLTNTTASGVCDTPIDSSSLLHPILLPRLYPTLFTLYALQTEKGDGLYAERLHQLNKRGDVALMSFLCVTRKFWLTPDGGPDNGSTESDERPYQSAIDTLGAISTTYSPMEKIGVIRRSFAKVHEEVDDYWNGVHKITCMDDLFPVFQYVVVRARVPHLGSEIQFIEDLVESSILVGEAGHMLTTLKACYFQIQNEQDRD